ncbi:PAS domain S-box-containing protein [Pedobacter sp. UYP24]
MKDKLKILHLEDSPDDAILVNRALKKGQLNFEIKVVDTKEDFLKGIVEFIPDVILSDHSLPTFNSYEALTIFKQSDLNIPFVLITATISEDFAVDIMKRGADDYVLKDRLDRLPLALQSALAKFKLANDVRENLKVIDAIAEEKNIILESIQDGFYALDKNWIVTYWNKEAEHLLGKGQVDIIGKNIWEEFPDSVGSISYVNYHKAVRENTAHHFEIYHEEINVWLEVIAYPSAIGLSIYFKNINERKVADLERMNMIKDILQRNNELEQFSYIVSHNLRAPVANISGLANELNQENLSENDIADLSRHLISSAGKLDSVIVDLNNIFHLKRDISEGKENVGLSAIVLDILKGILTPAERALLTVDLDVAAWDSIWTTKSYFYSIFYNLISNSLKYCRTEIPVVIKVKTIKTEKTMIVTFEDNCLGIDLLKHGDDLFGLYKRFHQHVDGKGMGLFMVKTQIDTLGGKISATSEVNVGTTFKMQFNIEESKLIP